MYNVHMYIERRESSTRSQKSGTSVPLPPSWGTTTPPLSPHNTELNSAWVACSAGLAGGKIVKLDKGPGPLWSDNCWRSWENIKMSLVVGVTGIFKFSLSGHRRGVLHTYFCHSQTIIHSHAISAGWWRDGPLNHSQSCHLCRWCWFGLHSSMTVTTCLVADGGNGLHNSMTVMTSLVADVGEISRIPWKAWPLWWLMRNWFP
jgi:hypothetical protein